MRKPWPLPSSSASCSPRPGPSGHEERAGRASGARRPRRSPRCTSDTLGTSFARVARRASGAPTLALVGHIDEIGVAVTHIEESGLLSFATIGGIAPEMLVGQRVRAR